MSEPRYRLHPVSALLNFLKGLKELVVPFLILFGANLLQGEGLPGRDFESLLTYGIGAIVLLFLLIAGVIKWKRFIYWFEEGELRIEYGLFVKKKRYIPFERIQSLDYTEGIFHRPLGLVRVKVETAGGQGEGAEAELTAIPRTDAERIEEVIQEAKDLKRPIPQQPAEAGPEVLEKEGARREVYRIAPKELLVLAATSGGIGVILSGMAVFLSQFSELIPYEAVYSEVMVFLRFGVLIVALTVFISLLAIWFISLILTVISNYRFTVLANDENIIITRGLLEKKRITMPFKRIQAVRVTENPLRELFGYATVTVESAGGSALEGGGEKIRLLPLVKKRDMLPVLRELFPDTEWMPELTKAPPRSVHFYYRLDFLWILPAAAVLSYFFFPYGLFLLLAVPLSAALGVWQHRTAGWAISGRQLTLQSRAISRQRMYVMRKRIQAAEVSESWFQRRKDIATAQVTVKSGILGATVRVEHLEKQDTDQIMRWYRPRKEQSQEAPRELHPVMETEQK